MPHPSNELEDDVLRVRAALTAIDTAVVAKADLVAGKVPAAQLPAFVDDVIEAANFAALPATGEGGKIYVTLDSEKTYRWGGSAYVEISPAPGSTDEVVEGAVNLYFTAARARAAQQIATNSALGLVKVGNGLTVAGDGTLAISGSSQAFTELVLPVTSNGQTLFTVTGGYTAGAIQVLLNGVELLNGDDYAATNGTSITLAAGVNTTDTLFMRRWATFQVADAVTVASLASQAVMEAGSSATVAAMSPLRVAQAIAALAYKPPAAVLADVGKVLTVTAAGTYGIRTPRGTGGAAQTASITLTASSAAVQRVVPSTHGVSVTFPDATTLSPGGVLHMIANAGGYDVALRNNAGVVQGYAKPGTTVSAGLVDNTSAAGVWVLTSASTMGVEASGELSFALSPGSSGTIRLRGAVPVDSSRDLLLFHGDARLYAVVWDAASGAFGTPVLVRSATFSSTLRCLAIKSATDQVLVVSCDASTGLQAVALSLTGAAITVNTAATATLAGNFLLPQDLIAVAGQGFAFAYSRDTTSNGVRAITVSGTTVAIGAEATLGGNSYNGSNPVTLLDAGGGKLLAFSSNPGLIVNPYTMAGTTLTPGTQASASSNGQSYSVRALASGRWALIYQNSGVYGALLSLAGTVASVGTPVLLGSGATSMPVVYAKGSQVIVCGDANGSPFFANVLTDNAGTAVAGTAITRDGSANTAMLGSDADSVWLINSGTSSAAGRGYRIGISGNNPVVLNAVQINSAAPDTGGIPIPAANSPGVPDNTQYGRQLINPAVLQGSLASFCVDGAERALMWRCSGGAFSVEPRPVGAILPNITTTNQYCRIGLNAQWAGAQSSTTTVLVQKLKVA